ncbi:MAG: putative ATP synthase YscN [Fimbriimonadaceae bacterium]|nr:putative ATP synthase YscN [Fimbriimonadaceae bacterium]
MKRKAILTNHKVACPTPTFGLIGHALANVTLLESYGRITNVVGLVAEATGPAARLGEACTIHPEGPGPAITAEVVGFRGETILLMPLGSMTGIRAGSLVRASGSCLRVPVGRSMLGRVFDAIGRPIDGEEAPRTQLAYPVLASPPNAMQRTKIDTAFATGVRAIDGLLTLGEGQRVGIFAGSGVGKSTLLGMVARRCSADINVIALVGERGRELKEFIEHDLGPEGLARSVIICATSDEPALMRIKAALSATAIAEYFRDQGASVMLMMDSITRFAMAQREIGLAIGEPPSTKGYTPSVFAVLPQLLERAGRSATGSITAIYTVLVEGDDTNEPIADAARAILDGHIVLSRKMTGAGHYPPIDPMESLSRIMPMVTTKDHESDARQIREWIGAYRDVEDLLTIGAYKPGGRPVADTAIAKWPQMMKWLRQDKSEGTPFSETIDQLREIVHGEV